MLTQVQRDRASIAEDALSGSEPLALPPSTPASHQREGQRESCTLCRTVTSGRHLEGTSCLPWDEHLLSTDGTVALASLGAIVPGWVLILPRRHVLNVASLYAHELKEFWQVHELAIDRLRAHFGSPVVSFEHGPMQPGSPVGCTVDHAHLHVVPCDIHLPDAARAELPGLSWMPFDRTAYRHLLSLGKPYLTVQDASGTWWAASSNAIPSQALRRVIATHVGLRDTYDWRAHPCIRNVESTVAAFGAKADAGSQVTTASRQ